MDVLERIKQSKTYNVIAIICVLFTFATIIRAAFIYFNWIPGYYVEWHKTDSIKPIINLFPGQSVRFDMGFYEPSPEIVMATWQITKGSTHFDINQIKPTFTLPPAKGGTYILSVTAQTIDGQIKKGASTINVVQDEPIAVQLKTPTQVKLTSSETNPELLKEIQSKGVEVYSGNGQWTKIQSVSAAPNEVTFGLQPHESVSLYGDKMLIRVQGSASQLTSYGAVHIPKAEFYNKTK